MWMWSLALGPFASTICQSFDPSITPFGCPYEQRHWSSTEEEDGCYLSLCIIEMSWLQSVDQVIKMNILWRDLPYDLLFSSSRLDTDGWSHASLMMKIFITLLEWSHRSRYKSPIRRHLHIYTRQLKFVDYLKLPTRQQDQTWSIVKYCSSSTRVAQKISRSPCSQKFFGLKLHIEFRVICRVLSVPKSL